MAVQAAYIGACTGAKLDDLRAAPPLRGRRVAAGVMVAPSSLRDQNDAEREGVLQTLLEARAAAHVLRRLCRATAVRFDGATVISTTARNFKGRMGSETAQVYLASPYSVAARGRGPHHRSQEVLQ